MNQAQDGDFCISEKNNAEWGKCCQKEQNKNIYNVFFCFFLVRQLQINAAMCYDPMLSAIVSLHVL